MRRACARRRAYRQLLDARDRGQVLALLRDRIRAVTRRHLVIHSRAARTADRVYELTAEGLRERASRE
jgi:hypothetical protein